MTSYINLNRLDEAEAVIKEARAKNLDSPKLRLYDYELAFLHNDPKKMAEAVQAAAGKGGEGRTLLHFEARTAAYSGQLTKARELSRLAVSSAAREHEEEREANFESSAAMWEALSGNASELREHATTALALSLAFAGDSSRAEALAADLGKRLPEDTIVQLNYLPAVQAQVALNRKDSANALQALQSALPYDLGVADSGFVTNLLAVYVRGQAYLTTHRGREAATEFQKILDHRGIVVNDPMALLHISPSPAPTSCKAIPLKLAPRIGTSSRSGKTPTPTSQS